MKTLMAALAVRDFVALATCAAVVMMLVFSVPFARGASPPTKATIHIPGKSLAVMVFYFRRETLRVARPFTPEDLEDMSIVKKVR